MPTYLLTLPDAEKARTHDSAFAFTSASPDGLAAELEHALRGDALYQRWLATQDDPDAVPPAYAQVDPGATVAGSQRNLNVMLEARTSLSAEVLRHRLNLLAGHHWTLNDVH